MNTRVYVVDDDEAVRDALTMMLEAAGHDVAAFSCGESFLAASSPDMMGCLILDLTMPRMDGLQLQEELKQRNIQIPIIFLSGQGTIPATVRSIKAGAMDFLTKPTEGSVLLAKVNNALDHCQRLRKQQKESQSATSIFLSLTSRELEIMQCIISGQTSKQIAQQLNISYRTVEVHRAHVIQKTGVSNFMELARLFSEFNHSLRAGNSDDAGEP